MFSSNRTEDWKMWLLIVIVSLSGLARGETEPAKSGISLEPPQSEIEGTAGKSLVVTCHTDLNVKTKWRNPKKEVVPTNDGRVHVEMTAADSGKGHALVFKNVTKEDRGSYTCTADKDKQASFKLVVILPTSFGDTPVVQYVVLGRENATLHCNVTGDPKPSIMWHLNGKKILNSTKYQIQNDGLLIRNVSMSDGGSYMCQAYQVSNSNADMSHIKITVHVQHKPTFQNNESDLVYGYISGVVNLTCRAIGVPKPKIVWIKDKKTVVEEQDVEIIEEDHSSTLQLTLNDNSMFGDYACMATNELGSMEKLLVLQEGEQPQPPQQPTDIQTTADSVHLKIITPPEKEGALKIMAVRVQYVSKSSDNISWDGASFETFEIAESYTLRDLSHNTEYAVRAQSQNAAGFSVFSEPVLFRTETPPRPVNGAGAPACILAIVVSSISAMHLL